MLQLYNNAYSTCSQKVRLCLAEKRLEFEDVQVSFLKFEHLQAAYLKINRNGVVPTLVHDGVSVLDSSVIIEYLDELFPEVAMSPPSAIGRAEMRSWLRFFEEVPTVAVRYPSFKQSLGKRYSSFSDQALQDNAERRPLRTHFYEQMGRDGFGDAQIKNALQRFRLTIERMEDALAAKGPWLLGDRLTLADACVAPLVDRMEDLGLSWLWTDASKFIDWFARWKERPSYEATFYPGTRLSDIDPNVKDSAPSPALLRSPA